ncbi:Hsp70 chaperone [Diaporthe australafricana]|uniref:Hsp70 chaperone n=1 Tax=Diaporthe australafricana TaxID=127596 RepID=A0ABR3WIS2_9PEZI
MPLAIGIDIGTANTRVAVFRNGRPEIIPDADGRHSMPFYVAFTERCRLFASAAKAQATSNPQNTVYGVKRILGHHLDQATVTKYIRDSPNVFEQKKNGQITISVSYKKQQRRLSPVQTFAMLVAQARANAEAYLGETIHNAVISVPANFDSSQVQDVRDAAFLGGVNLLDLIKSIDSISLYYLLMNPSKEFDARHILILNFGSSFFSAGLAVLQANIAEITSCASDELGTEDVIDRLVGHFAAVIQRKWDWDIKENLRARRRLRQACEVSLRDLSSTTSTEIYIDSLYDGRDFSFTLSRARLEELCQDIFYSTLQTIDRVIPNAARQAWPEQARGKDPLMEILIVGGGSRIPMLRRVWSDYFGSVRFVNSVNADEGEVFGSCIQAAILSGDSDVSIARLLCVRVMPFSIGIERKGGKMAKIFHFNTTIPNIKREKFLASDFDFDRHQPLVLNVYQGEKRKVKDNIFVGALDLSEIPPGWDDEDLKTKIDVRVDVDQRQQVSLAATVGSKSTSAAAWHKVAYRSGKEMEDLLLQAESYKEDDAAEEARLEERCALDMRVSSLRRSQPAHGHQTAQVVAILQSLGQIQNWVDENEFANIAEFRSRHQTLHQLEIDMQMEGLRAGEITGLYSYAGELRTKLLATTQTPKIRSLLNSVDAVAQWVEKNDQAEIEEYQTKLRSLVAISVDLIAIREVPPPSRESTPSTPGKSRPESPRPETPRGLDELFPESGWDRKSSYTDAEFEWLVSYLRNTEHESWTKAPRIYTVLRLIGKVDLVDAFLQRDITDIWFPFSESTLPKLLKQPHRAQFLRTQEAVFSKALELARGSKLDDDRMNRRHAHFSHGEPLPFKVIAILGSGAHGFVDKVVSTLSYREYARKRFKRSAINKKDVKTFLNEVKILKSLRHKHCIDMVGSYSDPQYFVLLTSPVAECNLERYYTMAMADRDKLSILRSFFGCLAGTLDFLHSQKVVHQDIKPQNILVKDNSQVLVADFGIARSWEGLAGATTTADLDRSWVYAAPEVVRGGPKNESADVWSLGCVFLEICTVLGGKDVGEMRAFFRGRSDSTSFHHNAAPGHVAAWVDTLRSDQSSEDSWALEMVEIMLQIEPRHRHRPFELLNKTTAMSETTGILFCGACCRDTGVSLPDGNDLDRWSEGDDDRNEM